MPKKKTSTVFVCQECGYESLKYLGKCPECGNWNTLKEFKESALSTKETASGKERPVIQTISDVVTRKIDRLSTGFNELDTVLGGGIVQDELILLSGDPGIGKSTLLLQAAMNIAKSERVLYVTAEESAEQVSLRAKRLAPGTTPQIQLVSHSDTDQIVDLMLSEKPSLVIIDSIQTMESASLEGLAGSVGQVRYATQKFLEVAKRSHIAIILVGHVTKEGMVAGPMVLSHMVDAVLFLEGEKFTSTRIIRSFKNRFGPVDEVGVFLMQESGMQEVSHPELLFMTKREKEVPGSILSMIMEGTRPFLVEVQALTVRSYLPMPRRVCAGFDQKRLELLLAVLQKHCNVNFSQQDVFVNIAGGLKVQEPAMDLAVCLALVGSLKNVPSSSMIAIGEIGLLGEVRSVGMLEKRIKEAKKLGFSKIVTPETARSVSSALSQLETV